MINADITARREKLMMLGFANLIATGFMHAAPSDFMRSLPPFANTEGKPGFTLPEDLRVAYEALRSDDPADDALVGIVCGEIAHGLFGGRAETGIVIGTLANAFTELAERDVMLPDADGVRDVVAWMRRAAEELPATEETREKQAALMRVCQKHHLFGPCGDGTRTQSSERN